MVVRPRLLISYAVIALAATAVMLASHFEAWSVSTRYLVAAGVVAAVVPGLLVWINPPSMSSSSPIGRLASFEDLGANVRRVLASSAGLFSTALLAAGVLGVLGHWQVSVLLVGLGSGFVLSALRAAYEELVTRRKTEFVRGSTSELLRLLEPRQAWLARREPRWIYNAEGDLSRTVAEQLLGRLAMQLSQGRSLHLADREVDVYEPVFVEWRQEIGLHYAFIFEIKWYGRDASDSVSLAPDATTYGVTADRASQMLLQFARDLVSGESERVKGIRHTDAVYVVVRHERDPLGAYRFVVALDLGRKPGSAQSHPLSRSLSDLLD